MYCNWCGSRLPANQETCPQCGKVTPADISTPTLVSVNAESSSQEAVPPSYAPGPFMEFSVPDVVSQAPESVPNYPPQSPSLAMPQVPPGYARPFPMPAGQIENGSKVAQRQRLSRGMVILLVVVALCVIASGIGLFYYAAIAQPAKLHAQATATAQVIAKASATAFAQSPQGIYERAIHQPVLVNQTLANNDAGFWDVINRPYASCSFINSAYHLRVSTQNHWFYCSSVGFYTDFAFQVQMTFIQGSAGGILFHETGPQLSSYVFAIAKDGSYLLTMIENNAVTATLASGHSPAIRAGLNQANLLTVVMQGSNIYLYANRQFLTKVTETTLTGGYFALFASTDIYTNSADIAFTNETLWD